MFDAIRLPASPGSERPGEMRALLRLAASHPSFVTPLCEPDSTLHLRAAR